MNSYCCNYMQHIIQPSDFFFSHMDKYFLQPNLQNTSNMMSGRNRNLPIWIFDSLFQDEGEFHFRGIVEGSINDVTILKWAGEQGTSFLQIDKSVQYVHRQKGPTGDSTRLESPRFCSPLDGPFILVRTQIPRNHGETLTFSDY